MILNPFFYFLEIESLKRESMLELNMLNIQIQDWIF